ncbi:MAG: hypothetical protein M3O55_08230 [Actinomycetota bacterium]|nr:hypothetical protein [Actinomycetota bacterium]
MLRRDGARRSLVVFGALGLLLATGACGATGAGRAAGQTSPATVDPDAAQPRAADPSPYAGEDGARGRAVATTPGQVTVAGLQGDFLAGGKLTAVVANGTAGDIYVQDLRTACSIAVVERETDATGPRWAPLLDCGAERLALVLPIAPGHGRTVRIDPQSLSAAGTPLAPGTYRLVVPWRRAPQAAGADSLARSVAFVVR